MKFKAFFEQNQSKFDINDLKNGHKERFLSKLNLQKKPSKTKRIYQFLSMAAVILLFFGIFTFMRFEQQHNNAVKHELQQNEQYFSQIIRTQLEQLQYEETPETKKVFKDAMMQIKILENDYQKLVKDYQVNQDKYLLNAMIENFKKRIDILQFVKSEIEKIKHQNKFPNEKYKV